MSRWRGLLAAIFFFARKKRNAAPIFTNLDEFWLPEISAFFEYGNRKIARKTFPHGCGIAKKRNFRSRFHPHVYFCRGKWSPRMSLAASFLGSFGADKRVEPRFFPHLDTNTKCTKEGAFGSYTELARRHA